MPALQGGRDRVLPRRSSRPQPKHPDPRLLQAGARGTSAEAGSERSSGGQSSALPEALHVQPGDSAARPSLPPSRARDLPPWGPGGLRPQNVGSRKVQGRPPDSALGLGGRVEALG